MIMCRYLVVSLFGLFISLSIKAQSSFTASVDKTTIKAGEPITLTLTYHGQVTKEPDLSDLERDFSVVSRQMSQESTMINGNFQAKTSWILEVFPKSAEKVITIPAIALGNDKTTAIAITQSEEAQAGPEGVSLVVTTDKDHVYINGELIVRIMLKTALPLRNGSLSKPEIKDAIVEELRANEAQEVIEQGVKYHVFTKLYAVYPGKAGTLVIPPIHFNGVVTKPEVRRGWPSFFSQGSRISARSLEHKVLVKDVPESFPSGHPFLPVKSFIVAESVDKTDGPLEVNKAYTRHFEIKAQGTLPSYLPTIPKPTPDNFSVYVEEGGKAQKNTEDGIEANRTIAHVYMPTAPGKLTVPEQVIYWWDVESDSLKTTSIRAFDIEVVGKASPKAAYSPIEQETKTNIETTQPIKADGSKFKFMVAAFLLVIMACIFIYALWRRRIKHLKNHPEQRELKHLVKNIIVACDKNDAHSALGNLEALQAWSKKHPHGVVFDEHLVAAMKLLEEMLFRAQKRDDTQAIFHTIKQALLRKKTPQLKTQLAPLYPL